MPIAAGSYTLPTNGFAQPLSGQLVNAADGAETLTDIETALDTLAGVIADGDKGDITVSSSGAVWNIDAWAVGATELASDAVTTAKILDSNVTTAKIADLNVTTGKLADAAVTTAKITDANVTAAKLATDAVETAKIKDANVTTAKLADAAVTLAKQADLAQATIIGRASGAGTGVPTALSGTQATVILDAFTGDSGSGGVKGLVPAPSAGDAAANKVLGADGTWVAQSGGGGVTGLEVHTPVAANTGPVAVTIDTVEAPIRKRLKSRYGINTTNFNGSTWISRAADLTGIADGKEGLVHFVVDFKGNDATATTILSAGNGNFKIFKGTDNKIRFTGRNAAASLILDMRTSTTYTASDGDLVVTAAWNLATGATHIYVNGVDVKQSSPTATNDTIDYTSTRWDVAADNNTQHLNGDLAHVLFDDAYIDLSDSRELRRFQTDNGLCAYMPGGRVYDDPSTKPLLFLTGNAINFRHNHGSAGNATAFTTPNGTLANGDGVNGSLYKDLAANDLQSGAPVTLSWDSNEGVWVAPIALKRTVTKTNYGATATTETLTLPMNVTELVIYGQGPGGGGGGGSTNHGGGGGGSGARGFFEFDWISELGGIDLSFTTRAGAAGGAGNGAGNGTDGTTPSLATVDLPDTLGGVQIQFGAGQGGKGGTTTGGRGGRGGNIATTTVDQGGSDYWPDGIGVTQFNLGSGFGETGFDTSGGEGAGEGDSGGGGGGGDNTAAGETSQGSYFHVEYTVEE